MLTEQQSEQLLQETLTASIESFDDIASTNDHAIMRSKQWEAELPLLVLAANQTAGRGRGANQWWASAGALTFSILFSRRHLSATQQAAPMTSLAIGVAVCDAVAAIDSTINARLKWPNDVFVNGKKLAGILIECPSAAVGDVVVGVGINVNNSVRQAPEDVAARAISLTDLLDRPCDSFAVLLHTLHQIEHQLTQMQADPQRVIQRCQELCVLTGRQVSLTIGERSVAGKCHGIAESGGLLIQSGHEVVEWSAGHVEVLPPVH